jgi:hypothetical protein
MAITENEYTGNGSTVLYSFTFPYLEVADIKVSLDGTLTTAYTLANATTVQFNTAPANGVAIRLFRQTNDDALNAQFFPGSAIRSTDLNNNFTQNLYVTQESNRDATQGITTADAATATANTALSNSSAAVSTANTASSNASAAVSTANTASSNASAAVSTANTASSNATTAVSTANAATATANSAASDAATAISTANSALSTANTASTTATNAVNTANSASSAASSAVSTANTASSNASAAVSTANTASSNATSAVNTANSALSTANAAASAVANAILYDIVANVAAIPASPANNDAVEVIDSTGIESFTPLTSIPGGFAGNSGLSVRIVYTTTGNTWTWIQYFPNDPETRYLKEAVTTSDTAPVSPSDGDLWYDSVGGRTYVYYDDGAGSQWVDTSPQGSGVSDAISEGDTSAEVIDTGSDGRFVVTTEGSERLRITSAGLVGIGTNSPGSYNAYADDLVIANGSGNPGITLAGSATGWGSIYFADGTTGSELYSGYIQYSHTNDRMTFATGGGLAAMHIDSSQRVGIGTTTPQSPLTVGATTDFGAIVKISRTDANFNSGMLVLGNGNSTDNYVGVWRGDANSVTTGGQYLNLGGYDGIVFAAGASALGAQTERMRIDSSGRVGIGTTSPTRQLHIHNDTAAYLQLTTSGSISGASGGFQLIHNGAGDLRANLVQRENAPMTFSTNDTERVRIDSSGRLLVGTSTNIGSQNIQIGTAQGTLGLYKFANNDDGGELTFATSRNGTVGSQTIVNNNDFLGRMFFRGSDGSAFIRGAEIACRVDGTPGANDMPGRLVFSTTADGASSPTERMRIQADGNINLNSTVYDNTTVNAANMFVNSGPIHQIYRSTSSIKYKTNVETIEDSYSDAILGCRPVWYRSLCSGDNKDYGYWGFIAEEVAAVDPRLVFWTTEKSVVHEDGTESTVKLEEPIADGVQYDRFVPHLLNLIKRQQQAIETLEATNASLEARLTALEGGTN